MASIAPSQLMAQAPSMAPSSSSSATGPRSAFFGASSLGAHSKPGTIFSQASLRHSLDKKKPLPRRHHHHALRGPLRVVSEKVVGIDLGTTNSAVAAMEGGKPTIVSNAEGQRTTPSVVAYTKTGDRLVGQIAKRQAVVNPENTFFSVKRFIGRKMSEVDDESKQVSYKVIRDGNGNVKLDCPAIGKQFAAEEISAQVCLGKEKDSPSVPLFYMAVLCM
jgi:hypothetical protein